MNGSAGTGANQKLSIRVFICYVRPVLLGGGGKGRLATVGGLLTMASF